MSSLTAVRRCPRCRELRPAEETNCEASLEGRRCNWDLTSEDIIENSPPPVQVTPPHAASSAGLTCPAGHRVDAGDLMCPVCGADLTSPDGGVLTDAPASPTTAAEELPKQIAGWNVLECVDRRESGTRRYRVRSSNGQGGILTQYAAGLELNEDVYGKLRSRIDRDFIAETYEFGRWEGRAFEVTEEITGGSLRDLIDQDLDLTRIRDVVREVAAALESFREIGLRHRGLCPEAIMIRSLQPLDLVITGFDAARLSDLDLDIEPVSNVGFYTAPETVMGGVSAASDWWGLGMIILDLVTHGTCFRNINNQVFLIHVLSDGVPLPDDLAPEIDLLLRGLLVVDRNQRWQWPQVRAWLDGESQAIAPSSRKEVISSGPSIELLGRQYYDVRRFTLEAARSGSWQDACGLLERGTLVGWAEDLKLGEKQLADLRLTAHSVNVPIDFRLGLGLKIFNPSLPFLISERIVDPNWLLDFPERGIELITGPTLDLLRRLAIESESWLIQLADRLTTARRQAREFNIELAEESLRLYALSTSRTRLSQRWAQQRSLHPDTSHPGIAILLERKQLSDEELLILLAAQPDQFRPFCEVLDETRQLAAKSNIAAPDEAAVQAWLMRSRRDLYLEIDERTEGFARCGVESLDAWADHLRFDRRVSLPQTLLLLTIPKERWAKPPHQEYVSNLLGFFEKRVVGAVLRGPLVRMTIGRTTPRVDLFELGFVREEASALLEALLQRTDRMSVVNERVFQESTSTEMRLRSLVSRAQMQRRDTGVNGLYFGFPFLHRQDRTREIKPHLAPLLLWPLKIESEAGRSAYFSLSYDRDREVLLNPALEGLLGTQAVQGWQAVRDDLLGRGHLSIDDVLNAFGMPVQRRQLSRLPEYGDQPATDRVVCAAVLFHVTFTGQSIAKDLRNLRQTPPEGSALGAMIRLTEHPPQVIDDDRRLDEHYCLTTSDPSQERAVALSHVAPGLLIQGPPGTGKSQTIVNLVADAIGREKTVLIICQKLQALNVVKKRLLAEGLADRIVMVTDVVGNRHEVLERIRGQLNTVRSGNSRTAERRRERRQELAEKIRAVEDQIDARHRALYAIDELTGFSYRQILGKLVELEDSSESQLIDVLPLRRLFRNTRPPDITDIEGCCESLGRHWLESEYEGSPLSVIEPLSLDEATIAEFQEDLDKFISAERTRNALFAGVFQGIDTDDPEAWRQWLDEHGPSFATDKETCAALKAHYALFTKYELGERYIAILEKIATNEQDWKSACIAIPKLDVILEEVDDTEVDRFADAFAGMAVEWLDARYEESPLHAIRPLRGFDEERRFLADFDSFRTAEQVRAESRRRVATDQAVTDFSAWEHWFIAHEPALLGADEHKCSSAARVAEAFRSGAADRYVDVLTALLEEQREFGTVEVIPALHDALSAVAEVELIELAGKCEPLVELWLKAKFERSPLSVARDFIPTPENLTQLKAALDELIVAEETRERALNLPMKAPPAVDFDTLSRWLAQFDRVLPKITEATCSDIARWNSLVDPAQSNAIAALLTEFSRLRQRAESLMDAATLAAADWATSLPEAELNGALVDAYFIVTPEGKVSFLRRLRRSFARRRVARRLSTVGIAYEALGDQDIYRGLTGEQDRRRLMIDRNSMMTLLGEPEKDVISLPLLIAELTHLEGRLRLTQSIVEALNDCPIRLDLPKVCTKPTTAFFNNLAIALRQECSRLAAAQRSAARLESLRPWFEVHWIEHVMRAIFERRSIMPDLLAMREAWPTSEPFLKFRTAAASPLVRGVFAAFDTVRQRLESGEISHSAVTRLILVNGRQAQLTHIEAANPSLKQLRGEALSPAAVHEQLRDLKQFVDAATAFPEQRPAWELVSSGSRERLRATLTNLRTVLDFTQTTRDSQAAFKRLAEWMAPEWNQACAERQTRGEGTTGIVEPIHSALPSLSAFQRFRNRTTTFDPATRQVLALIGGSRDFFDTLPRNMVDKQVRRVILHHAYSIRKRRIEGYVPSLAAEKCETPEQCRAQADRLSKAVPLAYALAKFPLPSFVTRALSDCTPKDLKAWIATARKAVERAEARAGSLATVETLRDRMSAAWIQECESAIVAGSVAGVLRRLEAIKNSMPRLRAYQAFRARAGELSPQSLQTFSALAVQRKKLEQLPRSSIGEYLRNIVRREALLGWKARLEQTYPMLREDAQESKTRLERLKDFDLQLKKFNREVLTTPLSAQDVANESRWEDVTRFRGQRAISLREFFQRSWKQLGLEKLRPVWLMIPDVASQLLPLERKLFDLVIYDEASQMPVEHAVPSLFRSDLVVVSGDEQQMPPSSSFKSRIDSDEEQADDDDVFDDELEEAERKVKEETWNRREIKDCPDLLHLGQTVLGKSTLQIHYRSEFGELIAFSNAAYYKNELSVPIRYADAEAKRNRPIEYLAVDGKYVAQTNEVEAQRVVELLAELWSSSARNCPSVGIVTFNLKQADLIEEHLEKRAEKDDRFRRAFVRESAREDDGEDMSLFIKNVENVQGDERDVIIFSTTFGKNQAGVFRRSFGALGQKGGERRLNVAVTRARKKIYVVTSMPIDEVSDMLKERRRAQTPRDYLQAYLKYARSISDGDFDTAKDVLERFSDKNGSRAADPEDDGVIRSIHRYIRSLGYEPISHSTDPVLGIDVSILDPETGRLAVGVDCDPPPHKLLQRARAREVWRSEMLERAYRSVGRISPSGWYHDREQEKRRLDDAILAGLGGRA